MARSWPKIELTSAALAHPSSLKRFTPTPAPTIFRYREHLRDYDLALYKDMTGTPCHHFPDLQCLSQQLEGLQNWEPGLNQRQDASLWPWRGLQASVLWAFLVLNQAYWAFWIRFLYIPSFSWQLVPPRERSLVLSASVLSDHIQTFTLLLYCCCYDMTLPRSLLVCFILLLPSSSFQNMTSISGQKNETDVSIQILPKFDTIYVKLKLDAVLHLF